MISYDTEIIGFITYFEKATGTTVKDCFYEGDVLVVVVQPGQLRKALAHHGEKIRNVSALTQKKIKLIEFNPEVEQFILNLLYPLKPKVFVTENSVVIKTQDIREKGQVFGREKTNLKRIQGIVNKYFKVQVSVD